jgi:predicted RNase H-like nuclease
VVVAGVDGCRAGWFVAIADGTALRLEVRATFADVLRLLDDGVTHLAVDMPIGLPTRGSRACDLDARRLLGRRRSSVFPAPPRSVLGVRNYQVALRTKREIDGVGLSKQAFNLLPKIAEVDAAITPVLQQRVVESHPELAFARLAGRPLEAPKRETAGRATRSALLESSCGARPPTPRGAADHDALDAIALTVTAGRLAEGRAERLGDGTRDAHGLAMEIAW